MDQLIRGGASPCGKLHQIQTEGSASEDDLHFGWLSTSMFSFLQKGQQKSRSVSLVDPLVIKPIHNYLPLSPLIHKYKILLTTIQHHGISGLLYD